MRQEYEEVPIPRELMLGTSEVHQFIEATKISIAILFIVVILHLHVSDYFLILGDTHNWSGRLSHSS